MGKKKSGRNSKAAAAAPKETATATAFVLKVPTHCRCDGCGDKIRSAVKDLTLRCEGILSLDQSALATKGELAVVATADPERLRRRLRKATGKDVGLVFPKPPANSAAAAVAAAAAKEAAAAAVTVQELLARMHLQQQQQQPVLHAHPVPLPRARGTRCHTACTGSRRTRGCCTSSSRRCPRSRTSRRTPRPPPGARTPGTRTTAVVAPTAAAADGWGSELPARAEEPVPDQSRAAGSRAVMELLTF